MTPSKTIVVDTFEKREDCFEWKDEVVTVKVKRQIRFIDSFRFTLKSLAELAGNLTQHCNLQRYFKDEQLKLVKRKGVYP